MKKKLVDFVVDMLGGSVPKMTAREQSFIGKKLSSKADQLVNRGVDNSLVSQLSKETGRKPRKVLRDARVLATNKEEREYYLESLLRDKDRIAKGDLNFYQDRDNLIRQIELNDSTKLRKLSSEYADKASQYRPTKGKVRQDYGDIPFSFVGASPLVLQYMEKQDKPLVDMGIGF